MATVTGEPLQPVRLYYAIPSKPFVTRILARLGCMDEDREGGRWVWLYEAEAEKLTFGRPRASLPVEVHPVVIGAIRFPGKDKMTLELRSFDRAIAAARFFGPCFGPNVMAVRIRVLNRLVDMAELTGGLDQVDAYLDRDVTVVDPRVAEERVKRHLAGATTKEEGMHALEALFADMQREREDVPLVEDFPLAPEEETPDFEHLANLLHLRGIRALEHWMGNTNLTLQDVVLRLFKQDVGAPSAPTAGGTPGRGKRKPRARSARR